MDNGRYDAVLTFGTTVGDQNGLAVKQRAGEGNDSGSRRLTHSECKEGKFTARRNPACQSCDSYRTCNDTALSHRLAYAISGFALYAQNTHDEFPLASGSPERAISRNRETGDGELWQAAIGLHRVGTARVRVDVSLSWSEQRSNITTPAIPAGILDAVPAYTARNRQRRFEAIADVVAELGPATATLGGAFLAETSHSRGTLDFGFAVPTDFSIRRRTVSGFAEATLRPGGGLSFNAAGRYDAAQTVTLRRVPPCLCGEGPFLSMLL